jgi:hypothetical protein
LNFCGGWGPLKKKWKNGSLPNGIMGLEISRRWVTSMWTTAGMFSRATWAMAVFQLTVDVSISRLV